MTTTLIELQGILEQTMQQAQRFPILRQDEERELAERWQATEDQRLPNACLAAICAL